MSTLNNEVLTSDGLFIVSTPLHLLVSLAIIGQEKLSNPVVWFIDQDEAVSSVFRDNVLSWGETPFASSATFFRPAKSLLKKKKERADTFKAIKSKLQTLSPARVFVGNDRRIEFQYAMHTLHEMGRDPVGVYMDEGIFTYSGRQASNNFSDRVIDDIAKKISYGFWWVTPKTVGESAYIQEVYASLPEHIHPLLSAKVVKALSADYWQSSALQNFSTYLLKNLLGDSAVELKTVDILITFPHESILQSPVFDKAAVFSFIKAMIAANKHVAVKYHPRDRLKDSLGVTSLGVEVVPQTIPFEVLIPYLKDELELIGQLSTPLITAKLLRPSFSVKTLSIESVPDGLLRVFEFLNIQPIEHNY